MLVDISLVLSKLKMVYTVHGKIISLTPDDLFSNFTSFRPLISPNTMTWSFFLVTLFFQALPAELQEAVQLGAYISPDISQLTTSLLQEQSLQKLREHTVIVFKTFADETKRIKCIMSTLPTDCISSHNNTFVESHHSSSSVKQTIVTYSNPEAMLHDRPLAVKKLDLVTPRTQLMVTLAVDAMTSEIV